MTIMYKFKVGDKVEWTNSNGVYLGERTVIGLDVRTGRPTYYIDPIDTPWFSVGEEELNKNNPPSASQASMDYRHKAAEIL